METQTLFITLVKETCCNCGIVFGLEQSHYNMLRETHGSFHCPNGHGQHYTAKTKAEEALDLLALEKRRREYDLQALERVREQRDKVERRLSASRGQITKIKNRISKGVCPCCNRHFTNLERHMATKHPEISKSEPAPRKDER